MAFDELLADRVRACLRHVAGVSERKMSGGLAFMIGGHLTAGACNDGLIARIGAQDMDRRGGAYFRPSPPRLGRVRKVCGVRPEW